MTFNHRRQIDDQSITLYPVEIGFLDNLDWQGRIIPPNDQSDVPLAYTAVLNNIQSFVNKVKDTDCPGVALDHRAYGSRLQTSKTSLTRFAHDVIRWFKSCKPRFVYSVEIEAFQDACRSVGITNDWPAEHLRLSDHVALRKWGDIYNELIDVLRTIVHSRRYKLQISRRNNKIKRNQCRAEALVNDLFEQMSRLLIVRIDLGYSQATNVSLEKVKLDRTKLLNNLRGNNIFKGLEGYIWKLEHGQKKGFHYHMIFIFDGAVRRSGAHIAYEIGEYWKHDIAPLYGTYYNCNQNIAHYGKPGRGIGIGMISRHDDELRSNLVNYVIGYLTKKDQQLVHKSSKREKTFGVGKPTVKTG